MTFLNSYLFEIVGRKVTIFLSFLLTACLYFLVPYTAPDINLLIAARCMIGVTMAAPLAHPLIADYVKRNSRGKAIALSGLGIVLGEVFSMGVIFNMTKSMNYFDAFTITAAIIFVFSLFFLYAVEDPKLDEIRNQSESRYTQVNKNSVSRGGSKRARSQNAVESPRNKNLELHPLPS